MPSRSILSKIFRMTRHILGPRGWRRSLAAHPAVAAPEQFPDTLLTLLAEDALPPYLPDLARLEWARHQVQTAPAPARPAAGLIVNPTLDLVQCHWRHLPELLAGTGTPAAPTAGDDLVAAWQDTTGHVYLESAASGDLAALKMLLDETPPQTAAQESGLPRHLINTTLAQARRRSLILGPPPGLRRDPHRFAPGLLVPDEFSAAHIFTLQWHLTQACDLHCRHCYDRSPRAIPSLDQGLAVLRQLQDFCRQRHVAGQISFTGGNPFLHPHFFDIYRAAIDLGFGCTILGNPVGDEKLEQLVALGRPVYYQVSLEGLEAHNDYIRGPGHFQRVLKFLASLRRFEIPGMVMLTLTRTNLPQILPLAETLRPLAAGLNFNRLARFGQGAQLELPDPEDYPSFLADYLQAAAHNPILSLKDNLFSILLEKQGLEQFGGCTGFGCGAAFNFLTLLSDGEVHACRKLPSYLGNLNHSALAALYDSPAAKRYRLGSAACRACPLHPACGGCLAVTAGLGLDPFTARDPFCFRRLS